MQVTPDELLIAVYKAKSGEVDILLDEAPIRIGNGENIAEGSGRALIRLQPKCQLVIEANFPASWDVIHMALSDNGQVKLKYGSNFTSMPAFILNSTGKGDGVCAELVPNSQELKYGESHQELVRVIFHIINFPEFNSYGPGGEDLIVKDNKRMFTLGRVILRHSEWQIEIQERPDIKEVVKRLEKTASYDITHIAELTRIDGGSFTARMASEVIKDLHPFLSFLRGAWSPPALCVGYDEDNNRAFEDWTMLPSTPWNFYKGWFCVQRGRTLGELYPGFQKLLKDAELGQSVKHALYWYLRSNRGGDGSGGIDSGIILSQAALERLSFTYLKANHVSFPKKPKPSAADYLRETLIRLQIPVVIPAITASLKEAESKGAWKDGPQAITRIRNELTHPEDKLGFPVSNVVLDGWHLSQWYIEMIILRLAGYNGEYTNRLGVYTVGSGEKVPWAK